MHSRLVIKSFLFVISLLMAGCSLGLQPTPGQVTAVPNSPAVLETAVPVPPTATATAVPAPDSANLENTSPLTLAWTYDAGDAINHPPLPVGDVVIAVPSEGPVLALDAATGALRWQFDPPQRIWDRAYASDGRSFFIGLEGGEIVALDVQSGEVRWQMSLGINAQTPLLFAEGVLYVPTTFVGASLPGDPEGKAVLFALDPESGQEIWTFTSDNYILQTPFRHGDALYVGGSFQSNEDVDEGGHMRLYALSAADGRVRWAYESQDGYPKQVFASDTAVAYVAYRDFVIGVDAATGEFLWQRDTGNWVPSLTGAGDVIFFGSANTIVHALDANDGTVLWQYDIAEGTFNYLLGAPVLDDDALIFLTQHGDILALNATDGALRWQFPTGVTARTGLSVTGEWLFLGDQDGIVYAYAMTAR